MVSSPNQNPLGDQIVDLQRSLTHAPTKKSWDRIGLYHHHGINIPLFSLHSENSCGIGEFFDLIPMIDWCASIGLDVIQLLPLNDTGFEPSPYNALSSLALNPVFLSLYALPYVQEDPELKLELTRLHKYKPLQRVAYEAVLNAKLHFLGLYYAKYFESFSQSPEYTHYVEKHAWLQSYALFKVLKDGNDHKGWSRWEEKIRNPSHALLKKLYVCEAQKINFYIFLQFLCHKQLKKVKSHAGAKGVFLKGDIPILISPESLDVWLNRTDFDLTYSVGSPPDPFSASGQNWGFPSYRWHAIEQTNYDWWRQRLHSASEYYDIFRVDHIVGFYRLWLIERGKLATEGFYKPSEKWEMIVQGEKVLSKLLSFSDMLPIGEDLALDVDHIRESMLKLGIPGTRIPRWEKHHQTDNSFVDYSEYPPFTISTVSTHDSETLTEWWRADPKDAKKFCKHIGIKYQSKLTTDTLYTLLQGSHSSPSLFHINLLNEYLALFPNLVWENPHDERINYPGTVLPSNWCYRFRPTVEEITSHKALAEIMRSLIS